MHTLKTFVWKSDQDLSIDVFILPENHLNNDIVHKPIKSTFETKRLLVTC